MPANISTTAVTFDIVQIHPMRVVNRLDLVAPSDGQMTIKKKKKTLKYKFVSYIRRNDWFAFRTCTVCVLHLTLTEDSTCKTKLLRNKFIGNEFVTKHSVQRNFSDARVDEWFHKSSALHSVSSTYISIATSTKGKWIKSCKTKDRQSSAYLMNKNVHRRIRHVGKPN